MLYQFVQNNFISLVVIFYLLIFMATVSLLKKEVNSKFVKVTIMSMILIIVNYIELWTATSEYLPQLRALMTAIGHSLRPVVIIMILFIQLKEKIGRSIYYVSLVGINAGITLICLIYSDFIYNLEYISHITCYILLSGVLLETCSFFKKQELKETLLQMAINLIMVIAIVLEDLFEFEAIANSGIVVTIMFHFLNCHTQDLKLDQLTASYNLNTFYIDADKYSTKINAMISIDMNNLKEINDSLGHHAGDAAIVTMVNTIKSALSPKCRLYRMGGDEFAIMCVDMWKPQVEEVMENIEEKMKTTDLIWSMGMAYGGESLDAMLKEADAKMYEEKRRKKALK